MKHAFTLIVVGVGLYSQQACGQQSLMTNCTMTLPTIGSVGQYEISVEGIFPSSGYMYYTDCSEPCSCVADERKTYHVNLFYQPPTGIVLTVIVPWQVSVRVCDVTTGVYRVRCTLTNLESGSVEINEVSFEIAKRTRIPVLKTKLLNVSHDHDQNEIHFPWQGLSTSMYTVQSCTNLLENHWSDVPGYVDMPGQGTCMNYAEPGLGKSQFLRLLTKPR